MRFTDPNSALATALALIAAVIVGSSDALLWGGTVTTPFRLMAPLKLASTTTWVLESEMFPDSHSPLRAAILNEGHCLVDWDDEWWINGIPSNLGGDNNTPTFFHGSLGNAARIHSELTCWKPGSYCNASAFCCSALYDTARDWLLHKDWRFLPANVLVDSAFDVGAALGGGASGRIFVRPDSPLKPFSGRVLDVASVSLKSLDHGFYFEDESLPVVACPICNVGREWRFVVLQSRVIAGSAYDAATRSAMAQPPDGDAWKYAQSVASAIPAPADVYVLDVCENSKTGELKLLELNPFGGADLYACDARAIVQELTKHAVGSE